MANKKLVFDLQVKLGKAEKATEALKEEMEALKKLVEEIGKKSKKSGKDMEDGFKAAQEQAQALPGPIGAAATAMGALRTGALKFVKALKTVKGALIASGIGALAVIIGSIATYFQETERGAQALRVASAALGAVMGALSDVVVDIGEGLYNLFTSPMKSIEDFATNLKTYVIDNFNKILSGAGLLASAMKKLFAGDMDGALDDAKQGALELGEGILRLNPATGVLMKMTEGAIELGKEIAKDVEAATELADAFNKLKVSQRELNVETARRRADIKELNKLAEDITKSFSEREAAASKAAEMETVLMNKRLANAAENVRIIKEQNRLPKKPSEEDLDKLANAEIALANIRMESMELQTTIQNKLNTIRQQEAALTEAERVAKETKAKEDAAKELDLLRQLRDAKILLIEDEEARDIAKADAKLQERLAKIQGDSEIELELRKALEDVEGVEIQAIKDKYALEEEEKQKAHNEKMLVEEQRMAQARVSAAQSVGDLLGAIGQLIQQQAGEDTAAAKVLAVAQIAINTAVGVSNAIASASKASNVYEMIAGIAAGIAAVVSGAGQASAILNKANVPGPSAPTFSASTPSSSAPSTSPVSTNTTQLSDQSIQQAELAPIQAFVVETELTGAQGNVSQIQQQATFP